MVQGDATIVDPAEAAGRDGGPGVSQPSGDRRRLLIGVGVALAAAACRPGGGGDQAASTAEAATTTTTRLRPPKFTPSTLPLAGTEPVGATSTTVAEVTEEAMGETGSFTGGQLPRGGGGSTARQPAPLPPQQPPPTAPPPPPTTTQPPPPTTTVPPDPTVLPPDPTVPPPDPTVPPTNPTVPPPDPTVPPPPAPPPPPPGGLAALAAAKLSFGVNNVVATELMQLGHQAWIEDQLSKTSPDPEVEAMLGDGYRILRASRQEARDIAGNQTDFTIRELSQATIVRARYSRHQLYEQMCMVWGDHFNAVVTASGTWHHLQVDYNERVIRANAMGRFSDLLVATAHAPCMLVYLDNYLSNANSPNGVNENYARELLELHTLGIHPDGSHVYTEADIKAVAVVMSGWSIQNQANQANHLDFLFRPNFHGTAAVSILGGQWSWPARNAADGKAAGDNLLQFLARHPSTARYVSRRLVTRFVSDDPPESLVDSAAAVYLANDTQIVPVLRHIFNSPEFLGSYGVKLRRPFEYIIAALRGTEAVVPANPTLPPAATMRSILGRLGNAVWGWTTPDGFPDFAEPWTSSDGILQRWQRAAELARNVLTGNPTAEGAVTVNLRNLIMGAPTLAEATSVLAARFGVHTMSAETRDSLLAALGRQPGEDPATTPDAALASIAGFLLSHPDAQHR